MKHRYFPGLNALRFYAALSVVIKHLSQFPIWFNYPDRTRVIQFAFMEGKDAVTLFFVLSGFLITYLLLTELAAGKIDIPKFYARRALRIWPAYFFVVFIGFAIIPLIVAQPLSTVGLPEVVLMLPNVGYALGTLPPMLTPLWSIGVEEQFYLLWPVLMQKLRRVLPYLFTVIIVVTFAWALLPIKDEGLREFLDDLRFESMAVGGIGAYLLFYQHRALKWIYHPLLRRLAYVFFAVNVIVPFSYGVSLGEYPHLSLLLSVIFLYVIMNVGTRPGAARWLDRPLLNRLGDISYGIYLYHAPVIYLLLFILIRAGLGVNDLIYYPAAVALTLAAAFASRRWLEKPFLQHKPQPQPRTAAVAENTAQVSP